MNVLPAASASSLPVPALLIRLESDWIQIGFRLVYSIWSASSRVQMIELTGHCIGMDDLQILPVLRRALHISIR